MKKSKQFPELSKALLPAIGTTGEEWLAERMDVSQAAVSYWVSGYNRPSRRNLIRLVSLLDLDLFELAKACEYDFVEIENLHKRVTVETTSLADLIQEWTEEVKMLREEYLGGLPLRAIEGGAALNDRLNKELARNQSSQNRKPILHVRSQLLHVMGLAFVSSLVPIQAARALEHVALELDKVAIELNSLGLNDHRSQAWAAYARGDMHYCLGRWDQAQWWYKRGLEIEKDPRHQIELVHGAGLSSAYMGKEREFIEYVDRMKDYQERGLTNASETALISEAKGRGLALLGQDSALRNLVQELESIARNDFQGKPMILRIVQFKRSSILAQLYLKPSGTDIDLLGTELSDTFNLARRHGYLKYTHDLTILVRNHVKAHPQATSLLELLPHR